MASDKVCRKWLGCRTGAPGRMESRGTEGSTRDVTLRDTTLNQRRGLTFLLRMRSNRKLEGKEGIGNITKILGERLEDGRIISFN